MDESRLQDRITLDYDSVCTDIEEILGEIRSLRGERFFLKALGNNAIQKLKEHENAIRKRLRETFSLVVIGDFKRGKSTLINAILGEDVLPSAVTPETVTINRISYSETPKAEAVLKSGKRAALEYSELKRDVIERLMPQLPSPIEYVDIKSNNPILKDITVVDTPGIGDLLNSFDEQIAKYLVNADALVYVVSARAPFSASEQAFLVSAVIPQSFSQVMVVVNMADILETEENITRIKTMTAERSVSIGENATVYMISALDELCRKKGLARPAPDLEKVLEDNFVEFENALKRDIVLQKDIIKSMRAVALINMMIRDTSARIKLVKSSLNVGTEKLNAHITEFQNQDLELRKSIERHKTSLANDVDEMKAEAKNWVSDFMLRLKSEIQAAKDTVEMADIERHFQFYMMDLIKNAVTACVRRHQQDISVKATAAIKEMAQEVTEQVFGGVNAQIADSISDVSWTGADTAMFSFQIADQFLGISQYLGPLYLIGQAIMGFVRQKTVERKQSDFISPILQEYDSITTDVINSLNKIYGQLKYHVLDILDEMYQRQTEASTEAIDQAKELMLDEEMKKEDAMAYLDVLAEKFNDFQTMLTKYN